MREPEKAGRLEVSLASDSVKDRWVVTIFRKKTMSRLCIELSRSTQGFVYKHFAKKMRRAVRASEGEGREKERATDAEDNGERVLWEDTETGTCGLTETGSDRTTDDDDGLG